MMSWFGPVPFGPVCETNPRVPAPVDMHCTWCSRRIMPFDRGILLLEKGCPNGCDTHVFHLVCMLRMVRGEH